MPSTLRVSPDGHQICDLVAGLPPGRFLLGLSGAPGAGKSTLADALAVAYRVPVVPMDGFHRADAELVQMGRLEAKGAPDTFDAPAYASLLSRVRAGGRRVPAPAFDHRHGSPVADAIDVPAAAGLVVTEGNYLLLDRPEWVAVRRELHEVWHLVGEDGVRTERLVRRHYAAGRPLGQARAWVDQVDQANARLVEAAAGRADLVVDLSAWSGRVPLDAS